MAAQAETRQVRMGEHFIEDALPRVESIFEHLRHDDLSLKDGRYARALVYVRGAETSVEFVAKDYDEEYISRRAVMVANIKYSNLDSRKVEIRLEQREDKTASLRIKDTLFDPPFGGISRKTVETATFVKDGQAWKIEDVSKVFIDEKKVESHLTDLTPKDVIAGSVLGHAWEVMEASETSLRMAINGQKRIISEFLQG